MRVMVLVFFWLVFYVGAHGQPGRFERAHWISPAYPENAAKRACAVFNKVFSVNKNKNIKTATLSITTLGLYEAILNGKRIGTDYFTPGLTSYDRHLQYQQYDVTELLKSSNELRVTVGDGWYRGEFRTVTGENQRNIFGKEAGLLLQLDIRYIDGSSQCIVSDSSWVCAESGIRYSELYDGEMVDTRMGIPTDVGTLYTVPRVRIPPSPTLIPMSSELVRKHETFKPVKIFTSPKGEQLIDFGQNLAGWVQVSVKGKAGDTIRIYHAEVLDKEGNFYTGNLRSAKATDTYILNGKQQTLEPHFTYHGFRYAKLEGINAGKVKLTAVALYSDLKKTGTFACSNPLINQLQHNIEWSLNSNFFEVPTDCPQRSERLGWTGDAQVFAGTASYLRDTRRFYAKWLADLALGQGSTGAVPAYIPLMAPGLDVKRGVAGWGDAATIIPWTLYEAYADTAILRQQYASMKAWVDYIDRQSPQGLWKANGYGDWYAQGDSTSLPLIDQAFFAHSAGIVAQAAGVLQQAADAGKYGQLAEKAKRLFAATYGDSLNTQTACILALQFKLLPDALQKAAAEKLVRLIHDNNDHLATGFLGTPYLLPVLSAYGYSDLAYTLLNQKTCPSWLYPITKGATTIWEKWDAIQPDGTVTESSYNHYSYGAVGRWLYGHVAGIRAAEPGYKKIIIKPEIGGGLTWAKASYSCDYGKIVSEWKLKNGKLSMKVEIPEGTTAEVHVPNTDGKTYKKHAVGSGKYNF